MPAKLRPQAKSSQIPLEGRGGNLLCFRKASGTGYSGQNCQGGEDGGSCSLMYAQQQRTVQWGVGGRGGVIILGRVGRGSQVPEGENGGEPQTQQNSVSNPGTVSRLPHLTMETIGRIVDL